MKGNSGVEVIVSKAALSFSSCFDNALEVRIRSDGLVHKGGKERLSIPKALGQVVQFKGLSIFKWDGVPMKKIQFLDMAKTLHQAYFKVFA